MCDESMGQEFLTIVLLQHTQKTRHSLMRGDGLLWAE